MKAVSPQAVDGHFIAAAQGNGFRFKVELTGNVGS